ncbi:MAG: hypothetical protein ABI833_18975 [Acidobacteriota bacterium]
MTIRVENAGANTYHVTVEAASTTQHTVTVTPDYLKKLTGGRASAKTLIEKSFEFLLERESNSSILRTFDLPVIQRYFPEYERTITAALREP